MTGPLSLSAERPRSAERRSHRTALPCRSVRRNTDRLEPNWTPPPTSLPMAPRRKGRSGPPGRVVTDRAVRKDILVFVEGERTEEDYLVHWHRAHRSKVNLSVHPFRGAPRRLIEEAAREKRKGERDARRAKGRAYDEVWCVLNVDEHPFLNEVETTAVDNDINLAVSSPCLELWFVLHFQDQTAHIERHIVQRRSAQLLRCGKALSAEALAALEMRHTDARQRAQALDTKHSGDGSPPRTNPSSGAWRLVQSIRTA